MALIVHNGHVWIGFVLHVRTSFVNFLSSSQLADHTIACLLTWFHFYSSIVCPHSCWWCLHASFCMLDTVTHDPNLLMSPRSDLIQVYFKQLSNTFKHSHFHVALIGEIWASIFLLCIWWLEPLPVPYVNTQQAVCSSPGIFLTHVIITQCPRRFPLHL